MFIPIRTDTPVRHRPWANWILIALNVLVFWITNRHLDQFAWGMLQPGDLHLWQFFTYTLLHANAMHLAGNMLFLYIFGNNVNDRLGHSGYLAFYLAGGIFAGILHCLTNDAPVLGASGAISAVSGAYLILLPRSSITIIYFFFLVGTFQIASIYFILFYFVQDLLLNFFTSSATQAPVAHMAHVGGTIFGIAITIILLGVGLLARTPFDMFSVVNLWNRRRQYRAAVRSGWNPYEAKPPSQVSATNPITQVDAPNSPAQHWRGRISDALSQGDLSLATELYLKEYKPLAPAGALPRQAQLDVANHLAAQEKYPQAADAYETYLTHYSQTGQGSDRQQIHQIWLMLGIIYGRYLQQFARARHYLEKFASEVHNHQRLEMAQAELARLPEAQASAINVKDE